MYLKIGKTECKILPANRYYWSFKCLHNKKAATSRSIILYRFLIEKNCCLCKVLKHLKFWTLILRIRNVLSKWSYHHQVHWSFVLLMIYHSIGDTLPSTKKYLVQEEIDLWRKFSSNSVFQYFRKFLLQSKCHCNCGVCCSFPLRMVYRL